MTQNAKPLTVLQVVPALDAGGVERTAVEIAAAIVGAGGRALVASEGGRLERELAAAGGELFRMPAAAKDPLTLFQNVRRLEKLIRAEGVDIVHARSRAPAWSALLAARRAKARFVTTYAGIYNARSGLKRFYNGVMARGDVVIANSAFTRDHVLATYPITPDRVLAIPRGVDLSRFDPKAVARERVAAMRQAWGVREGQRVALCPARLTRWKGQLVFLDAAGEVEKRRPGQTRFVVAGDAQGRDDFLAELRGRIQALGLTDAALVAPHIDDMPAALLASDVAVFPSVEPEAFGRGAVEAQAMGRPAIVTDNGAMAETILDGVTGVHVSPGDAVALAKALDSMLSLTSDERAAMGAAGAERAKARYSISAMQQATLDVYRCLLERGA